MKKLIILSAIFFASLSAASAQELGIRFGDVLGNDVAIDGVFSVGEFSRLHADVSFGDNVGVEVLYDFFYKPLGDTPGLNWYIGVGPSLYFSDPFFLGASGEIGLEYHFDFPLALGADWRPTFWLIEETDFRADSFGINARFVF
ncbi:MAG: outer membrane insertion C- signal [Reichenbachiella sp.]|uniref:outer membrane insertion C- signal n=1 Tax=Reichenbachiella sp. TaxID=2184521 RepID=UPI003296D59C